MALKIETNQSATAYHVIAGPFNFPYAIDASHAISGHPFEWKDSPWSAEEAAVARQHLAERNKAEGLPPPPEPAPLSIEEQAMMDEHNKLVAAAGERLAAFRKKKSDEKAIADQVAADEALVASAPPRPDPDVRRPPLTPAQLRKQSAMLTPEELAAKKAAD